MSIKIAKSVEIRMVAGQPALILKEKNKLTLVVADLHIGRECFVGVESVARSLIKKNLDRLRKIIKENSIDQLIILGDIRDFIPTDKEYWQVLGEKEELQRRIAMEVPDMLASFKDLCKVDIVPGNHDGGMKSYVNAHEEMIIGNVGIFHGHRWPSKEMLKSVDTIVASHSHPAISFMDQLDYRAVIKAWAVGSVKAENVAEHLQKAGKTKTKIEVNQDIKVIIVPAFNDLITGTAVNENKKMLGPTFKEDLFNVSEVELYTLDGIPVDSQFAGRSYAKDKRARFSRRKTSYKNI